MSECQTKAGNQNSPLSHSLTLDMLNNFCFHLYAQKSRFSAKSVRLYVVTNPIENKKPIHTYTLLILQLFCMIIAQIGAVGPCRSKSELSREARVSRRQAELPGARSAPDEARIHYLLLKVRHNNNNNHWFIVKNYRTIKYANKYGIYHR